MTEQPPQSATQTLTAWQQRAAELARNAPPAGVPNPTDIAALTGLQIYEDMLAGRLPAPPICETLDFALVEVELGRVVFQARPMRRHYNPMGTVHGGWMSAVLDSAMASAIHTRLPPGKIQTTAELKVNFVRPLTERVPLVRAEGHVIHLGGRMATSDARLFDAEGKLYAHGSTTCFIYDLTETMRRQN